MRRYLLSTVRSIHDRAAYLSAWRKVRDAVTERGGHAWIFSAANDADRFIEFIEWKQTADGAHLIDETVVRSARAELEHFGTAAEELWKEAETS